MFPFVFSLNVWSACHMHWNSKGMHSVHDGKCCSVGHHTCSLFKNSEGVSPNMCKASFCTLATSCAWKKKKKEKESRFLGPRHQNTEEYGLGTYTFDKCSQMIILRKVEKHRTSAPALLSLPS